MIIIIIIMKKLVLTSQTMCSASEGGVSACSFFFLREKNQFMVKESKIMIIMIMIKSWLSWLSTCRSAIWWYRLAKHTEQQKLELHRIWGKIMIRLVAIWWWSDEDLVVILWWSGEDLVAIWWGSDEDLEVILWWSGSDLVVKQLMIMIRLVKIWECVMQFLFVFFDNAWVDCWRW